MTYFARNNFEKDTIRRAYEFEINAIEFMKTTGQIDNRPNPYKETVLSMADGEKVWEAIEEAIEMAFN